MSKFQELLNDVGLTESNYPNIFFQKMLPDAMIKNLPMYRIVTNIEIISFNEHGLPIELPSLIGDKEAEVYGKIETFLKRRKVNNINDDWAAMYDTLSMYQCGNLQWETMCWALAFNSDDMRIIPDLLNFQKLVFTESRISTVEVNHDKFKHVMKKQNQQKPNVFGAHTWT